MNKKEEYINRLHSVVQSLETNISAAKQDDSLPFSFFKESFKKSQEITSLIHELEMLQIEDMKSQMERLIRFLSESESKSKQQTAPATPPPPPVAVAEERNGNSNGHGNGHHNNRPTPTPILPTYTNPLAQSSAPAPKVEQPQPINHTSIPSVNDVVPTPGTKVDVKRRLSLNDRFFFQRELFANDREAMNAMMVKLNTLDTIEEMEEYLRANTTWDFESENVKSFLEIFSRVTN